jgi:hypothetical protein
MSSPKWVLRLLAVFTLVAILTGCASNTTPTAAPTVAAPTVNPQPTFNAISTQAAQTVVANLTQNAPKATATIAATATSAAPTATLAPTNPPATLAPAATQTPTFIPWTLTPTAGAYACSVTSVTPKATDSFTTSANIDGVWVVKNTGTSKWLSAETDARYVSGTKLQKSGDIVDLTTNVAPGESYTVGLDMVTPSSTGTYTMSWALITGKVTICTLNMTVVVK